VNKSLRLFVIALLHLALLWGWIALLDARRGPMPPMGRFLSPFEGFWRNAEPTEPEMGKGKGSEFTLEGLTGTVVAEFDRRGVPHLFAPDLHTLFFAQGFVTARDRLWQMDIQSRAGMGRLAEIMGPGLLRFDQERRRMGVPASAVGSLEIMLRDSLSRVALEAYSEGVNAWISSLKPATYPLEFKLLAYAPEPWTPLKSTAILKNMQWTLSQNLDEAPLTRVLDSLGSGFFARYYPLRHPGAEPMLPDEVFPAGGNGGDSAKTGRGASARAELPFGTAQHSGPSGAAAGSSTAFTTSAAYSDSLFPRPFSGSGSNAFVLAGSRTRAGYPLLANDPHLDLTLPALWYETQLKGANVNAYGASLPGLPGLAIGFTAVTAWGFTNGMDDVFDWVAPRFRNDSLNQYLWRGRWRATRRVFDTILVRGHDPVVDTQLWTHLGPVPVRAGEAPFGPNTPALHALQWTALQPSNEVGAFLRLLGAEDVPDFRRALRGLQTPTQNAAFATRWDIAMLHQGRIPVKRNGQGRLLARSGVSTNAATYAAEWRAYIPTAQLPGAVNPARGWLGSANQEITSANYPFYLGSAFYPPERSQRLNRLLFSAQDATLSSAWDILLDNYSRLAARALPLLLRQLPPAASTVHVAGDTAGEGVPPLSPASADSARAAAARHIAVQKAADLLRAWDYRYGAAATAPVLFDLWWKEFYRMTWADEFPGDSTAAAGYPWPSRAVTVALLLQDTLAEAFDDVRTARVESAGDLARAAFDRALERADNARAIFAKSPVVRDSMEAQGAQRAGQAVPANEDPLTWGRYRPVSIPHLLRLAPLGVSGLATDGCGECVNAQRGSHGPSWRMVVQTGKRPEAWGIYPGGQSGNPGSPRYDAFVKDWAAGRAYRLLFLKWPLEVPDSTAYILALKGKR
jgi:penicillin amidase